MTTIYLYLRNNSWMTHWQGDYAAEMLTVMGTVDIPTPYTDLMPADEVLANISRINPDCNVFLI